MTVTKKPLAPDFSEGVDRKLLKQIRDRFLEVNQLRLQRTYDGLSARHQDLLRTLPLLYHVNHPLMPGYTGQDTPKTVALYQPDNVALEIAKSFSQSFKYRKERRLSPAIESLFMMGSTGTLAHSESSDVDVWLCIDPSLSGEALAQLEAKVAKVDQWANEQGLELHTFIMNAESFRAGKAVSAVDSESSGSAQHYLLLDEFYRTAILLAGRYPLWWLIPPGMETQYAKIASFLLDNRFIKATEYIDLGCARDIPKSELVGAGLWQLYKSLDAPYKSVLKLMLAEAYSQELPHKSALNVTFKQAVYDDELDPDYLDPYLLIYRRLEEYLNQAGDSKRLDLVRKSFYLKVNKKLTRHFSGRRPSWQRRLLEKVTRQWGWPESRFRYLDERSRWRVDQVIQERQEVLAELTYSYRFLANFARANNVASAITREDLNILGRKLYATFQRKAGKVEKVNPGIAPQLWEENLAIHHASSQPFQSERNSWLLYRDLAAATDASFHPVLKKTAHLIELLGWLYCNGIMDQNTRISLVAGERKERLNEVKGIVAALAARVNIPLSSPPQKAFEKPAHLKQLLLFVNIGVDPMDDMSEKGLHRLSDRTDALSYSSRRHNLVRTIDQIGINSWHEVSAQRYEMGETLLQTLQSYLQTWLEQYEESAFQLDVFCFCPQRADSIANRVKTLFQDIKDAFFPEGRLRPVRYVMALGERFHVFLLVDDQFRYLSADTEVALYETLAQGTGGYCPVVMDAGVDLNSDLLAKVLPWDRPGIVQVFYRMHGQLPEVVVLDEAGSAYAYMSHETDEKVFLSGLHRFINHMLDRRQMGHMEASFGDRPEISLNRVSVQGAEDQIQKVSPPPDIAMHEIVANGFLDELELKFDYLFRHLEFSHEAYGDQQLAALMHYIQNEPELDAGLPVKVVDLAYPVEMVSSRNSHDFRHGTIEYLQLYQKLEERILSLSF